MAKKSNKTAHVLNLLSGHDAAKEAEESSSMEEAFSEEAEAVSQSAPAEGGDSGNETSAAAESPSVPETPHNPAPAKAPAASQNNISLIDTTGEDPVADLIQEKLSSEFEKQIQESQGGASAASEPVLNPDINSTGNEEPVSEADSIAINEAVTETVPTEIDEAVTETVPTEIDEAVTETVLTEVNDTVTETIPAEIDETVTETDSMEVNDTVSMESEDAASDSTQTETSSDDNSGLQEALDPNSVEKAEEPVPVPEPEPDFAAVNVMERIVNDKIIYFMRQFDVCTCDRCKADVIALTLNGLMPKYIVTMPTAVDPLISFYTNRLISDVTVEATKACMVVKENPRH